MKNSFNQRIIESLASRFAGYPRRMTTAQFARTIDDGQVQLVRYAVATRNKDHSFTLHQHETFTPLVAAIGSRGVIPVRTHAPMEFARTAQDAREAARMLKQWEDGGNLKDWIRIGNSSPAYQPHFSDVARARGYEGDLVTSPSSLYIQPAPGRNA